MVVANRDIGDKVKADARGMGTGSNVGYEYVIMTVSNGMLTSVVVHLAR